MPRDQGAGQMRPIVNAAPPTTKPSVLSRVFRRQASTPTTTAPPTPRTPTPTPASSTPPSPGSGSSGGSRGGAPSPALRSHPISAAAFAELQAVAAPALASHPVMGAVSVKSPPPTRLPRAPPAAHHHHSAPPPLPRVATVARRPTADPVKALVATALAKAVAAEREEAEENARAAHGGLDEAVAAARRLVARALSRAAASELGDALGPPHLCRVARDKAQAIKEEEKAGRAGPPSPSSSDQNQGPSLAEALGAPRPHRLVREAAAWATVPRRCPGKWVRRILLLMGGAAGVALPVSAASAATPPPPPQPTTLRVGASPAATHASLAAALSTLSTATDPVTILVEPGTYTECVVIGPASPPVKILALRSASDADARPALTALASMGKAGAPGLDATTPPTVTLAWSTASPYESVVDVAAPRCALAGVRLQHSSPSVANNAAVFVRETGSLTLQGCAVTSATGNGIILEGSAAADGCEFSGCKKGYGAAAFGQSLVLTRCAVTGNGRGGVLARGVSSLSVSGCAITRNGGPGLDLVAGGEGGGDAPAAVACDLAGNAGGSVRVGDGWAGGGVE